MSKVCFMKNSVSSIIDGLHKLSEAFMITKGQNKINPAFKVGERYQSKVDLRIDIKFQSSKSSTKLSTKFIDKYATSSKSKSVLIFPKGTIFTCVSVDKNQSYNTVHYTFNIDGDDLSTDGVIIDSLVDGRFQNQSNTTLPTLFEKV